MPDQRRAEEQRDAAGDREVGPERQRHAVVAALERDQRQCRRTAPTTDDSSTISGSICQPSHAPSAASSLKSP